MTNLDTIDKLESPLDIVWQFDYAIGIDKLRDLYSKAKKDQWNGEVDLDWSTEIDPSVKLLDDGRMPFTDTKFYKSLSTQTQTDLNANNCAYMLSQFLHGEQGALMVAAQLVDAVPDYEGKLYAATQVMDEARHVEVFEKYCTKLAKVYPLGSGLREMLDATLTAPLWQTKCVGMQMIVEGLALGSFINMKAATDEPLLKKLLEYVIKDEARHVAYGNVYVRERIEDMSKPDREELEDFVFKAITGPFGPKRNNGGGGQMIGPEYRNVLETAGIDPDDFISALMKEMQGGWKPTRGVGEVHTFNDLMMPSLVRAGVVTEKVRERLADAGVRINDDTKRLEELEDAGTIYH